MNGTVNQQRGGPPGDRNRTSDATTESDEDALSDVTVLPKEKRDADEALDIGEIFELLKNERRREVIAFLKTQEDKIATLDTLAEHIAAKENNIETAQLSSSQRKRVYIGLYQCHLPKMDDYGVIEYQKSRGIIELNDIAQLEPYLPSSEPEETESERTPLFVAVAVSAIVLVGTLGIGPLAAIPVIVWTSIAVAAMLVLAATFE